MKVYAVGKENNCVELSFASEDDADRAFNDLLGLKKNIGEVVDSSGNRKVVSVYCGYSKNKSEIMFLLKKK